MTQAQTDATGWRGIDQGDQLKKTTGWANGATGTNTSGFSALPGGLRGYGGSFHFIGYQSHWWSSTEYSINNAWYRHLWLDYRTIYRSNDQDKKLGLSVRCIKGDPIDIIPTNGLVAYFPFNGNANDESGNGNNGTVNGATLTTDRFGNASNAISFDGVNDYISFGAFHPAYTNFTLSIWIKPLRTIDEPDGVLGDACNQQGLVVQQYNTILTFTTQGGGSLVNTTITSQDINQWAHYTFVMQQGVATLYKNGISIGNVTVFGSNPPIGVADFEMGRDMCQQSLYWKGILDNIRIYNRTLSAQEIAALYNE